MSGFVAPFFTARPIWALASVFVVPPTILASRTSLSMRGLVRIATSISSSAATFCSTTPAVAYSLELMTGGGLESWGKLLQDRAHCAGAQHFKLGRTRLGRQYAGYQSERTGQQWD